VGKTLKAVQAANGGENDMMRLIRIAAVVGMVLALVDSGWMAVDAPREYGLLHCDTCHHFKAQLHRALRDQYHCGIWFGVSGILYVVAGIAARDRQQGGPG